MLVMVLFFLTTFKCAMKEKMAFSRTQCLLISFGKMGLKAEIKPGGGQRWFL